MGGGGGGGGDMVVDMASNLYVLDCLFDWYLFNLYFFKFFIHRTTY